MGLARSNSDLAQRDLLVGILRPVVVFGLHFVHLTIFQHIVWEEFEKVSVQASRSLS